MSELGDPAVTAARTDANAAAIRERALPDERGGLVAIFAFDDNFGGIFKPKSAVFDFDETEPDSRAGTWSCGFIPTLVAEVDSAIGTLALSILESMS